MVPIYKSECDAFLKDHYDDEEMMTDQISTGKLPVKSDLCS